MNIVWRKGLCGKNLKVNKWCEEGKKMYIVFIDESGQPGGYDREKHELVKNTSKYFILSGFIRYWITKCLFKS